MILVTGYRGFIGSHLVPYLEGRGEKVVGYDRHTKSLVELFRENNFDYIIHLAANVENTNSFCHIENIEITKELVGLAGLYAPRSKIIYSSTVNVYKSPTSTCCNEQEVISPSTLYEHSKYFCESIVKLHPNYTILRLSNVYGKGCHGVVADWKNRREVTFPNNDVYPIRCFTHVKDVVDAFAACIECPHVANKIYNICGNDSIDLFQLASYLGVEQVFDDNTIWRYTSYFPSNNKFRLDTSWYPYYTNLKNIAEEV